MDKLNIIDSSNSWLSLDKFLKEPPKSSIQNCGNNILHFNTKSRKYQRNASSKDFVEKVLLPQGAVPLRSDTEVLQFAVNKAKERNSSSRGLFLEFGFCTGRSLNFIAALAFDRVVYGFDSLRGLPYYWRPDFDKGTFSYLENIDLDISNKQSNTLIDEGKGVKLPFIPLDNCKLVIGQIEETLPIFKNQFLKENDYIHFIHIDTDIYESARCIYQNLQDHIKPGMTIIVLDEGYNYFATEDVDGDDEWIKHEFRATEEFARSKNYDINFLAFNTTHQQLALTFKSLG